MARRRRGSSSELSSEGESDDETNFKRRRRRSNSPQSGGGDMQGGGSASAQPQPPPGGHSQDGPRQQRAQPHSDIRGGRGSRETARGQGHHDRRHNGGTWRGGGRAPQHMPFYGSQQQQGGSVEPYVPEFTAGHGPSGPTFDDMPAAPIPLPLPFMPVMGIPPGGFEGTGHGGGGGMADSRTQPGWQQGGMPPGRFAGSSRGEGDSMGVSANTGEFQVPYGGGGQQQLPQGQGRSGWGRGGGHTDADRDRSAGGGLGPRGGGGRWGPGDRRGSGGQQSRAQATLYVQGLPSMPGLRSALLQHFSRFGQVAEIRTKEDNGLAWIQMSDTQQAENALKSPEAVLGNRFVRLSWAQRDVTDGMNSRGQGRPHQHQIQGQGLAQFPGAAGRATGDVQGTPRGPVNTGFHGGPVPPPAPPPRPARAQQGLQPQPPPPKQPAGKPAGTAAASEQAQQSLPPRQQLPTKAAQEIGKAADLLAKQIAEQKRMLQMIEAKQKGIACSTAAGTDDPPAVIASPSAGARVAARGGLATPIRGRGGRRGGAKFGGRNPHSNRNPGSSWSRLDTRTTTTIRVVELPPDVDLEAIKTHFSQFGEITSVEADPTGGARVAFEARKQAEAALIGGKKLGDNAMILQWSTPASSAVQPPMYQSSAVLQPSATKPSPTDASTAEMPDSAKESGEESAPSGEKVSALVPQAKATDSSSAEHQAKQQKSAEAEPTPEALPTEEPMPTGNSGAHKNPATSGEPGEELDNSGAEEAPMELRSKEPAEQQLEADIPSFHAGGEDFEYVELTEDGVDAEVGDAAAPA